MAKPEMTFTVETVHPQTAKKWLESNTDNRPVHKAFVDTLAATIKSGGWKLTHQAIAFSPAGILLDGQHRLMAILVANVPVKLLVARNADPASFPVIDKGIKRSMADSLRLPPREVKIVTFLVRLIQGHWTASASSWEITREVYENLEPSIKLLLGHCATTSKVLSSSPVQAAAVMSLIKDPANTQYILDTYRNLVLSNTKKLSSSASSFLKQIFAGSTSSRDQRDLYARALVVFDASRQEITKVTVREDTNTIDWTRQVYYAHFPSK